MSLDLTIQIQTSLLFFSFITIRRDNFYRKFQLRSGEHVQILESNLHIISPNSNSMLATRLISRDRPRPVDSQIPITKVSLYYLQHFHCVLNY